jgi:hypothetical protein
MALKDWKKIGNKWRKHGDYGRDSDEYLVIRKFNKLYHFNIETLDNKIWFTSKNFKTKQQALKFAKAYMRTH